jgi:urease accessory protein
MSSTPFRVWQLVDSGFPAGGFTHSGGLEAAARHGDVRNADDLRRVVIETICQAGYGGLPLVRAAHVGRTGLPDLDALNDAFLTQAIANRASRAQGRALLTSAVRIFSEPSLRLVADCVERERLAAHHAPVFGAVLRALSIDAETTMKLFLYQAARTMILAAVKLGIVGVFDGQRLQDLVTPEIERTVERCRDLDPEEIAQTNPILDLYQATHDRLYSRLFQS